MTVDSNGRLEFQPDQSRRGHAHADRHQIDTAGNTGSTTLTFTLDT